MNVQESFAYYKVCADCTESEDKYEACKHYQECLWGYNEGLEIQAEDDSMMGHDI